jgi:hypothetical protein
MELAAILYGVLILLALPPRIAGAAPDLHAPGQTFTSTRWGIALEYPDGWSVEDDGDEVTFRSEDGRTIRLGRPGTDNPSEPAPGRRGAKPQCSTTTTAHDVVATVCVDPTSMVRRAVLVLKTRDGRESRLAISTRDRGTEVFDAVVSSARPYP